jgi:hypothetical protein
MAASITVAGTAAPACKDESLLHLPCILIQLVREAAEALPADL